MTDNVKEEKIRLEQHIEELIGGEVLQPKEPGEVLVIQYLRPDGRVRPVYAPVGEEHEKKSAFMILSAEELNTGLVAIYARFYDEPPEKEAVGLAENGPGDASPTEVLKGLIDQKYKERYGD